MSIVFKSLESLQPDDPLPDVTGKDGEFLRVATDGTGQLEWQEIGGDGDFSCENCTFGDGSAAEPSIAFKSDPDTGMFRGTTANTIGISTNGQERVKVDNTNTTIKNKLIIEQNVGDVEFDGLTEYNEQILFGTNNTVIVSGFNKSVLTCRTGNGNLSIQLLGASYTNKTVTRFRVFKSNTSANSIRIIGSSEPVIFRTPFVSVSNFTSSSSPAFYDIIPNGFFGSFDLVRVLDEGGTPPNPSHEWRVENIEVYTDAGTEQKLGPLSINGNVQQNITGGDNGFFEISRNVENWQSNSNIVKDWFANMNPAQETFNLNQSWFDIIYNDVLKLYVALCRESFNITPGRSTSNKIATSPDGYTWTLQTTPVVPRNDGLPDSQFRWTKIDYNRKTGTMICVTDEPTPNGIMRSTDAINWTSIVEPSNVSWNSVSYFEHLDTWIGSGSFRLMYSTDDGLTWTSENSSFSFGPICYNSKTGFYYTGSGTEFRRTTTPLIIDSWVETSSSVAGVGWIVYSPDLNMILCAGSSSNFNNQVSYSTDNGETFTKTFISNDNTLNNRRSGIWCPKYKCFIVTCCNANFSSNNFGSSPIGKVFYSFNGIDWFDTELPESFYYWSLYYVQQKDTLIITTLNNGNTDNKFYLTNPNKLQPTADNLYNGIHQSMDNSGNWTFKKDLIVNGNVSTTNITATGDMSLTGAVTTNLNVGKSGSGNARNLDVYGTSILRGNADVGQSGSGNSANMKIWGDLEVTGSITGSIPAPSYNNLILTGTTKFDGPLNINSSSQSAADPAIFFNFSPTTGFYSSALNTINITCNNQEKMKIYSGLDIGNSTFLCDTNIYGNLIVRQNSYAIFDRFRLKYDTTPISANFTLSSTNKATMFIDTSANSVTITVSNTIQEEHWILEKRSAANSLILTTMSGTVLQGSSHTNTITLLTGVKGHVNLHSSDRGFYYFDAHTW